MRLVTIGGIAALASATALAACSDQPEGNGPMGPLTSARSSLVEGARFRAHGGGRIAIHGAQGATVYALPAWSAAGSVLGGVARDESHGSPFGVHAVSANIRGTVGPRGGDRSASFTDDAGNRHTIVWTFGAGAAPMQSMRAYINGELRSAVEYSWAPLAGGYALTSVTRHAFRNGHATSDITTEAAGAVGMASRGVARDALAHLAAAALRFGAPTPAQAQQYSGRCRNEWLAYLAAEAALAAADINVEKNPLDPVAWLLWLAAAANATKAEMAFWLCQQNEDAKNHPLLPRTPIVLPPLCKGGASSPDCLDPGYTY